MNVLLLLVDSLRARSLRAFAGSGAATPFMDSLSERAVRFDRAYATECWTLPTHMSMFTGLLPSAHQAHFQTMGYRQGHRTIAERLDARGFHTEIVTRNPIFDGRLPGVTRGFRHSTRLFAERRRLDPLALLLGMSKPRFRRQVRNSGFFHPDQRESAAFLAEFARTTLPADARVLQHALDRIDALRTSRRPWFLFCNLFDVHAPYCPSDDSLFGRTGSPRDLLDNLLSLYCVAKIGSHAYLRNGFQMPDAGREALLSRYHRAIELMDAKLERFFRAAWDEGLLDDTLVILTSDHGEAFGEHDLYLHDASVYETHAHVPLWACHPTLAPGAVSEPVSTAELFALIRQAALEDRFDGTVLDAAHRKRRPPVVIEHFYYPHVHDVQPRHGRNLAAVLAGDRKVVSRGQGLECFAVTPGGQEEPVDAADAAGFLACAADGARREDLLAQSLHHLSRFGERGPLAGAARPLSSSSPG